MKILESQQLLQVLKSCVHSHESPSTSKLKFATIDGNFYSALKYSSNSLSFSVCTISDTPCWNLGNAKFKSILTTAAATDCFFYSAQRVGGLLLGNSNFMALRRFSAPWSTDCDFLGTTCWQEQHVAATHI